LAVALTSPAIAQLEDKPVRMEKAPFYVFQNDYIILLNVNRGATPATTSITPIPFP
jgi:hypothetical protein